MNDYVDVIPSLVQFFSKLVPFPVYGNSFPSETTYPAMMVKGVGGTGYTRLQIVARAESDIEAYNTCIHAMNLLERWAHEMIKKPAVIWCEREGNPVMLNDQANSVNRYEAWVYMRLEHLEA